MEDFATKFIKQNLERASHVSKNDWEQKFYLSIREKVSRGWQLSRAEKNNLEILAQRYVKPIEELAKENILEKENE